MTKRPLLLTIIALLFIAVGCASLASRVYLFLRDMADLEPGPGPGSGLSHAVADFALAGSIAVAAVVGGVFLLSARNWARWLCVAWLAFHVALSVGHPLFELGIHALLFAGITAALFLPRAGAYFRPPTAA